MPKNTGSELPFAPHQPKETPEEMARRAAYRDRLRAFLEDPASRQIEGFPRGEVEDILALSDPPYYTACPNPFLDEILAEWQRQRAELRAQMGLTDEPYHREPFSSDVSEGKNHPIYNAHSYHTKVPHKAIMRYILHYTDPGDIVLDGFCGTGMTGVAAQLCADRRAVAELGFTVKDDGTVWDGAEQVSRLGARKAVLVDLSPAATFIAYNYNTPVDAAAFEREARRILAEVEAECGWMYETRHTNGQTGRINYTVWSDVYRCPGCGQEMVFWDVAVDKPSGAIREIWPCPGCGADLSKSPPKASRALRVERAWETVQDLELGQIVRRARHAPVLINYSVGKKRYEKNPDADDLALIARIETSPIPYPVPIDIIPRGDKTKEPYNVGITHVHQFYTRRNLWVLAAIKQLLHSSPFIFAFTASQTNISQLCRYRPNGNGGNLSGTLYIPSVILEKNGLEGFERKIRDKIFQYIYQISNTAISTNSSTQRMPEYTDKFDYIFVDPPFGANLMYSELNLIWEAWLRVLTNSAEEAIVNSSQCKGLPEYQGLMELCFQSFYRALKPGHWMTVEFHNSANAVWIAIQHALSRAGFVVADVHILDKEQLSFKQVSTTTATKQDLIISAYKPAHGLEERFQLQGGTLEGAWDFVRYHLAQLPVVVMLDGVLQPIEERQPFRLFDRMVAFHVQRGMPVPLSAPEFYAGLAERFPARNGMVFLPEQLEEYDSALLQHKKYAQLTITVSDEKSSIQWLRQQLDPALGGEPKTYADLLVDFQRAWVPAKHEALPELKILLQENFLEDHGVWRPAEAKNAGDLERRRQQALLKEFNELVRSTGPIKSFRTEAVLAGFIDAYQRKDYALIVKVSERLPNAVLQENADLLMYADTASLRLGDRLL